MELWEDYDDMNKILESQQLAYSSPIKHTSFKLKSVFNPTHNKGPYIEYFYQVVYSELLNICKHSDSKPTHS